MATAESCRDESAASSGEPPGWDQVRGSIPRALTRLASREAHFRRVNMVDVQKPIGAEWWSGAGDPTEFALFGSAKL